MRSLYSAVFGMLILSYLLAFVFGQSVSVISEKANLRGTPSQTGKVVSEVSQGESYELIKQKGPWFLVQTQDYVGWLHGNTIRINGTIQTLGDVGQSPPSDFVPSTPKPRPTPNYSRPAPVYSPPSSTRSYITGPRGGCYYYTASGRKQYVDRSLCN